MAFKNILLKEDNKDVIRKYIVLQKCKGGTKGKKLFDFEFSLTPPFAFFSCVTFNLEHPVLIVPTIMLIWANKATIQCCIENYKIFFASFNSV